jgi:chromosome segregation ATPase
MDFRNRSLALVVFAIFALVLAWVGYSTRQAVERAQLELARSTPIKLSSGGREGSSSRPEPFSNGRTELLRSQVDRLSARLNRLSELLQQKSQDYDALKSELDHSTALMNELLPASAEPSEPVAEPLVESEPTTAEPTVSEETQSDLAKQLEEARAQLAELEKEAAASELHIFALQDDKRMLASAASAALIKSGAAAAPGLADLLAHRRPEMRLWAATLLGEMGPDALSAVDALHEALSDADEEVRLAARKALRKIENP